jgi:hypothetical protein
MWQALRDYWLPMLLFAGASLIAIVLLVLVAAMPYAREHLPIAHPLLDLFADDATVRRCSIAGAIGLLVTAFVFFRPNTPVFARKTSPKPPRDNTMAGA